MTSLDSPTFSVARRGYDRGEVDGRLGGLLAELASVTAARDAAVADTRDLNRQLEASRGETQAVRAATGESRAQLDSLRAQVAELSTIPSTVDGMSQRLQQMVRVAQDEVNDMRTRATTSAAHVLELASAEADELRQRSESERREFESDRRTAEESLRAQLDESWAHLEQMRKDSEGQKAALESELAAEMAARRTSLVDDLGALETRQRREADRIVDAASQDARQLVDEATAAAKRIRAEARADVDSAHRELEGLRGLQHQVAEQLTSIRALLDWTLPQMTGSARMTDPPLEVPGPAAAPLAEKLSTDVDAPPEPVGSVPAAPVSAVGVPAVGPDAPERPSPAARRPQTPGPNGRAGQHR